MGKRKVGFLSVRQRSKFARITEAQRRRWQKPECSADESVISDDHNYCSVSENPTPDVSDVAEDIVVEGALDDWRVGRRIVELSVLADALSSCKQCGVPLQLSHAVGISTYGLSAIIKVPCSNTQCLYTNNVPTGKRHNRIWDANTKLVTAMLHAGVGGEQINSILAALNIPPVSNSVIQKRQTEAGKAIEHVAQASAEKFLAEEVHQSENNSIEVSVDAGWQKRGSGRSYDSLTGHCSMIGAKTGKVLDYAVRSKHCRVCDGGSSKEHECRKNWDGSSKAMEADMVVEMIGRTQDKGIVTSTITGDDDSSTIHRLRALINKTIKKRSDKNHVQKSLSSCLFLLQKHHKSLTMTVQTSIMKNFNYMIMQNQGNPDGISRGLDAMTAHPYDDHSHCDSSWCRFLTDKNAKFTSLPNGKPLTDPKLKVVLLELFGSYKEHLDKISSLGSTQANESFNKMVASKAPKMHHYGGSASLNYRVAASVAQKNTGQQYVTNVHKKIGISPGTYTKKLFTWRDIQRKKRKAVAVTVKAKTKRLALKKKRKQKQAVLEAREGASYSSNIDLTSLNLDIEQIPPATEKPVATPVDVKDFQPVYFDLETTGLARTSHIIQIACQRGDSALNIYVKPKVAISPAASEVTNIYMLGNQMYHGSLPVHSMSLLEAVDTTISFLGKTTSNVLIGHNVQAFDSIVLLNALHSCSRVNKFSKVCLGFIDTKKLFRKTHPDLKPHSQSALVKNILKMNYVAHDAHEDCIMLQKLVENVNLNNEVKLQASFEMSYSIQLRRYLSNVSQNMPTLLPLVEGKVVSKETAKRIAGSGLTLHHLLLAHKRQGYSAVSLLFSEICPNGTVRVTRSKKISDMVSSFIEKMCGNVA